MTMLIVDDNPRMRATIRALLGLRADQVIECGNGRQAVDLYETHRPDWVLMDVSMPILNGIQATAEICAIDSAAKIIIVTDFQDVRMHQEALLAGATGFVAKDDLSKLLDIVG